uniref:CUB domain-containing protein n=1 Tax=Macrostomum lignano TaxID=282301 RepID=A0A1I8JJS4_9PLAT
HRSPKKFLCSNQQMDLLQLLLTAFLGSLLAFETGSAVAVPADTGTIQCPENFGQPGAVYENSKVYNWTIRGPKAVAIRFHFAELETPYDRLEIFENFHRAQRRRNLLRAGSLGSRHQQYDDNPDKEPVFIDGPKEREGTSRFRLFGPVLVQVKKTQTRGRVFRLSYRSSDGAPQAEPSGQIGFPKGSAEFNSDIDYRWFISRDIRLSIRFASISLRPNGKLYIYENTTSEDEAALRFLVTNASSRESEFRLSGPVMIRLVASGDGQSRDFRLSYAADQSGNTDMAVELIDGYRGSRALIPENGSPTAWVIAAKPGRSVLLYLPELPVESGIAISLYEGAVTSLSNSEPLQRIPYASIVRYNGPLTVVYRPRASSFIRSQREFKFQLMNAQEPLVKDSGSIRCPQVSGETLESEMEYRWTINRLNLVVIEVSTVDIGSGVIELYEEAYLTDEPQQAKLNTGAYRLPGPVMVRFVPGKDFVGQGFNLSYTTKERTLHRIFNYDSGNIFCPETALVNYEKFMDYRWTINRKSIIVIRFDFIDIQDTIEFYEKVDESGEPDRRRWKLNVTQEAAEASNITLVGPVLIRFRTNSQVTAPGFQLYYQAGSKILDSGNLSYPENYGYSKYDNNVDYEWSIYEQKTVVLTFIRYDTESNYDWIGLYENSPVHEKPDENKRKYRLTGSGYGETYTLKGPVLIRFKTDGSGNRDGFRMTYYLEETSSEIGVQSSNLRNAIGLDVCDTDGYDMEIDRRWVVDTTAAVSIRFVQAQLLSGCDKLELHERTKIPTPRSRVFSLTDAPLSDLMSTEFKLRGPAVVRLQSRRMRPTIVPFGATFSVNRQNLSMTTALLRNLDGLQGCLMPDGRSSCGPSSARAWSIAVSPQQTVELQLFDAEGGQPHGDTVSVYTGVEPRLSESPIFSQTGLLGERKTLRASGFVTVVLRTDANEAKRGFGLQYSVKNAFDLDMDYSWIIQSSGSVRINVRSLNLQDGDKLHLYENTTSKDELKRRFVLADASASESEFWLRGSVLIRITAAGDGSPRSFRLAYQVVFLTVRSMGIQDANDVLEFYEKTDSSAEPQPENRKYTLTGDSWSSIKYVLVGPALIRFKTDHQNASRGFIIDYYLDRYVVDSGKLQCPENFGSGYYLNNKTYAWWIGDLSLLEMKVDSYDVETGIDKISFYEKTQLFEDAQDSKKGFTVTSDNKTAHVVGPVLIQFVTDISIIGRASTYLTRLLTAELPAEEEMKYDLETDYRWLIDRQGWVSLKLSHADIVRLYEMTADPSEDRLAFVSEHRSMTNATSVEFRLRGPVLVRVTTKRVSGNIFKLSYQSGSEELPTPTEIIKNIEGSKAIYPSRGPVGSSRAWSIAVSPQQTVELQLFDAEGGQPHGDTVSVYTGVEPRLSESPIFSQTGLLGERKTLRASGFVTVVLRTGASGDRFGLRFTYSVGNVSLSDAEGEISYSSQSEATDGNLDHRWIIDRSGTVRIRFSSINLPAGDKVYLYQNTRSETEDNLKFVVSDSSASQSEFRLSGPVLLRFTANSDGSRRDFKLTYTADGSAEEASPATEVIRGSRGMRLCNPAEGSTVLPRPSSTKWIVAPTGSHDFLTHLIFNRITTSSSVEIFAGDMDLLSSPAMQKSARRIPFANHVTHKGILAVVYSSNNSASASGQVVFDYQIRSEESKLRFTLTQANATSATYKLIGPVLIRFSTDKRLVGQGFDLSYSIEPRTVFANQSQSFAMLQYPTDANRTMEKWMEYKWLIPGKYVYKLAFNWSNLGADGSFIEVFAISDQASADADEQNLLFILTDANATSADFVLTGPLLIRVKTGRRFDGRGIAFSYRRGPVVVSEDLGTIKCPSNYGSSMYAKYANNKDYQWLIDATGPVNIRMEEVDIENCCDKIFIYDRFSISDEVDDSKLTTSLVNSNATGVSLSLQGPVLLRFKTDSSVTSKGFRLVYSTQSLNVTNTTGWI